MPTSKAARRPDAQVGRYCHICGRGMSYRLGALIAIGYHDDGTIRFGHLKCQLKERNAHQ